MDRLNRVWNLNSAAVYKAGDGMLSLKSLFIAFAGAALGYVVAVFWQTEVWIVAPVLVMLPLVVSMAVTLRVRNSLRIDYKTGLLNACHFEICLRQAFQQARRSGNPVSIIAIDVDRLKRVNDAYGHLAGDALLRTLGAIIREVVRERHFAGQLGGDEFAIVLPGMAADDARIVAERLRRAISAAEIHSPVSPDVIRATASLGIAQLTSLHRQPHEWFHAADMALNRAKQLGRDRVFLAAHAQFVTSETATKPA